MAEDELRATVGEESLAAASARGRWHAEYVGRSYRSAVERALARRRNRTRTVLKTDLWNEALGGARDVAGHFHEKLGVRFVGIDIALEVCALARVLVPPVRVVQADIRALPFRSGSFDAVLDLSTIDHLPEAGAAQAIAEYRRVLHVGGVLLLVFWQRSLLLARRLALKRLLGRRQKTGQHYFYRADVRAMLGEGLTVSDEFVCGALLVLPHALTGFLLGRLPDRARSGILRWVMRLERSASALPVLKHVAGLYAIAALRRPTVA